MYPGTAPAQPDAATAVRPSQHLQTRIEQKGRLTPGNATSGLAYECVPSYAPLELTVLCAVAVDVMKERCRRRRRRVDTQFPRDFASRRPRPSFVYPTCTHRIRQYDSWTSFEATGRLKFRLCSPSLEYIRGSSSRCRAVQVIICIARGIHCCTLREAIVPDTVDDKRSSRN